MPLGAIASIRVRMTESVPGSQPAEMMETASCLIACAPRERRRFTMSPWMSKLSTVLMPRASRGRAVSSTLRVGVQSRAASTWPRSSMLLAVLMPCTGSLPGRRTMPASSISGAARKASTAYFPMLPYPTMATLIILVVNSNDSGSGDGMPSGCFLPLTHVF